jgi:hypothetical protein
MGRWHKIWWRRWAVSPTGERGEGGHVGGGCVLTRAPLPLRRLALDRGSKVARG